MARSLEGNWRADVLFELLQAVDTYHFEHRQMQECDDQLTLYLESLPGRTLEIAGPPKTVPKTAVEREKGEKTTKQ